MMDRDAEIARLKGRVAALEDVLLQLLTRWDFEGVSEYRMGRSDWEVMMDHIKRAREAERTCPFVDTEEGHCRDRCAHTPISCVDAPGEDS